MASVWKHPHSPYWTGTYADDSSRTRRYSTKERRRAHALLAVQHLEDLARQARDKKLSRREFDEEVARIRERLYGERNLKTAREFFRDWLAGKTLARSAGTATRYASATGRFISFLDRRADRPLREIAPADCQGFHDHLLTLRLAPATLVVELKTLRTVFNSARRQQLVSFNPAETVELPQHIRQVRRKTFTPEQVEIILREAGEDSEWATLILFGCYTAMRLGDAKSRSWPDVDFANHKLTYRQGKTGDELQIPLHPRLEEHLMRLAADGVGQICSTLTHWPVGGRNGLSQKFIALMRRAGIATESVATGGHRQLATRSFHSLRKSFNSWLRDEGVSQEDRRKLTGHKSDAMNDRYTETKLSTLRAAVNKLPKLEKLNTAQLTFAGLEAPKSKSSEEGS